MSKPLHRCNFVPGRSNIRDKKPPQTNKQTNAKPVKCTDTFLKLGYLPLSNGSLTPRVTQFV